jgi:hypothetical protein
MTSVPCDLSTNRTRLCFRSVYFQILLRCSKRTRLSKTAYAAKIDAMPGVCKLIAAFHQDLCWFREQRHHISAIFRQTAPWLEGRGITVKKAILSVSTVLVFVSPAYAQTTTRRPVAPPNPVIVRTPPSSQIGAGLSAPSTSSITPTYPAPIKNHYDPLRPDPTMRNPNLRR